MNLLDRILTPLGYKKATGPTPAMLMAVADSQRWDMPEATEAEKQARLYAALTWIATAIDRTAEIGSSAHYSVVQHLGGPDGDDEDIPNHPLELLLRRPNPMQSGGEFLRDALSWFKLTGNLYLHLNAPSEGVPPDELWIIPSSMMKPIPDGRSYVAGYEFTAPGKEPVFVPRWQVLHLKTFNPLSPFVGLSAVQSLALDSYGDIAQQKWNLSLFDKNNGKMPGILAFKHMIGDPEWMKIQKQRDTEWGGTQRAGVMLLRGVGDTVQWLPAAMSQKEMEFLAGRTFTKEEIYGKLAPGLASILAVNATEANAIAGKSTLIEFGVWPMLDQLGQKMEAELLPLYGEGLGGAYDDIRQSNRILDLQEQAEYAKYHTINEVRREYYAEDPLELDETQVAAMDEQEKVAEERREAMPQQMQQPPVPAAGPPAKAAAKPKLDPRGFLFVAQVGPTTPLPGDTSKPIAPPPPPPMPPPQLPAQVEAEAPPEPEAKASELAAWERLAVKHLGRGYNFEPRVLDLFTAGRIRAALKAAGTETEVRRVFAAEREPADMANAALLLANEIRAAREALNG